jgi:hypothetical protein
MSKVLHFIQKRIGRAMSNRYLVAISAQKIFDCERFSKWVLINAAERTYHGQQSEKEDLLAFVEKYLAGLREGAKVGELYKAL